MRGEVASQRATVVLPDRLVHTPATTDYPDHQCQPADVRVSVDDVGLREDADQGGRQGRSRVRQRRAKATVVSPSTERAAMNTTSEATPAGVLDEVARQRLHNWVRGTALRAATGRPPRTRRYRRRRATAGAPDPGSIPGWSTTGGVRVTAPRTSPPARHTARSDHATHDRRRVHHRPARAARQLPRHTRPTATTRPTWSPRRW